MMRKYRVLLIPMAIYRIFQHYFNCLYDLLLFISELSVIRSNKHLQGVLAPESGSTY